MNEGVSGWERWLRASTLRPVTAIELYGTATSPYVRRVHALAIEFGLDCTHVDTASDEGQARLRALSPVWKIPAVVLDGAPLFDSRVIGEELVRRQAKAGALGEFAPLDEGFAARNLSTVIDGALDSLINVFYLGRDGVAPEAASYLAKQGARAASAMTWVEAQLDEAGHWLTPAGRFGLPELNLITTLEWMRFRATYPVDAHPKLAAFVAFHTERPSLVATRPPA